MLISLIVAMSDNRVIGRDGQLPWHLPEDLKRFRRLTEGHAVIMGRKTYESIGRPLPRRENIVLTRQSDFAPEGVTVCPSLDAAFDHVRHGELPPGITRDVVFVIGGGEIYRQAISLADRLFLTCVHTTLEGVATFPEYDRAAYIEVERELHQGDLDFSFVTLHRRPESTG